MELKFPFELDCDHCLKYHKELELGSDGEIAWSIDVFAMKDGLRVYMDIKRSDDTGNVKIHLKLQHSESLTINWKAPELQGRLDACKPTGKITKTNFATSLWEGDLFARIDTGLYAPSDKDLIKGTVTIVNQSDMLSIDEKTFNSSKMTDDYVRLLHNPGPLSDFILKCDSRQFPVHKCVLSARSPVFEAMFTNPMLEAESGVVEVTDIAASVVKHMLTFVYSGKLGGSLTLTLAADLLPAAEKYQLADLKAMCVRKLKTELTVNNFTQVLFLGDMYDESLKVYVIQNIGENIRFSELEETEGWKTLQSERPSLVYEVMSCALKFREKK